MVAMALELKLREIRKKTDWTQADLADAVGVRIATISDLENDNSRRIDFDLLEKLCKVLSAKTGETITPNDLFGQQKKRRK